MNERFTSTRVSRRQIMKGAAFLSLGAVAAACTPTTPAVTDDSGSAGEQPGAEGVAIEFITPGALGLEREMYTGFIDDFQEANPNISVSVSFEAWDDYMTKLPTMLAGGVVPDMIHQHMSIVQDYAHRGALSDLVPFMERDGINPEDYIPALFDAFSNRGSTYGIPKDSAAWGVYYNKDMFNAAGLDTPSINWTLEDFQTMALELTLDSEGRPASDPNFDNENVVQWGFNWMEPTATLNENARGFVRAFGGDWYDETYTETLITEEPVLEDLRMFHRMRCVENSIPTPAQAQGQGDPFRVGLTAMAVSFHIMDFFSREEEVDIDYDVTFIPGGPGGQYSVVGCSGWAVPTDADNKDEGWELVKFLTSAPVQESIGQQKRWGVSLREAVGAIEREDGYPENFATVHTDPFKGEIEGVDVIAFKFPPQQSRIKDVYATEFDPIWTCASDDVETAAANTKEQVDELLAELDW